MEEFKSKLTEQTEGDTESLSSEEETSNPSLSGNDQEDGLSNPDSISEPVVRALAAALTKIETYVPTQYVDYTEPDINAENLNHAEQAIMRVTNALNGAVDAINQLSADIDSLNSQHQKRTIIHCIMNSSLRDYLSQNLEDEHYMMISFSDLTDNPFTAINGGFGIAFCDRRISEFFWILGFSQNKTEIGQFHI